MTLIKGKLVKLTFNGADVPFKSSKLSKSVKLVDVTDNSSTGDSIENQAGRQTVEIEVSGVITKTGTKQIGKDCKLTFNSVDYKTTALGFEETFSEHDRTSGSSAGNSTEFDVGFAERKFTAEVWQEDSQADPPVGVEHAATVLFDTGVSATGNAIIDKADVAGEVKGDQKISVSGTFNGVVTQTSIGLTGGTSATALLTFADGATTDKAATGTAILTKKKVSTTVDGDVAFTYTFKFTGAVTETEKV